MGDATGLRATRLVEVVNKTLAHSPSPAICVLRRLDSDALAQESIALSRGSERSSSIMPSPATESSQSVAGIEVERSETALVAD